MLDAVTPPADAAFWSAPRIVADVIDDHPVMRLFPRNLQRAVAAHGRLRRCAVGETVSSAGAVGFVVSGGLAPFDARSLAAVGLFGPGATFGWETSLSEHPPPLDLLCLLEAEWVEVPASALREAVGPAWLERVFARHALDRMQALQGRAACHAVHAVPQRVASLVHALSRGRGGEVRTTQAALAAAMGVQRTSVNAALKDLERDGAVRTRRARLQIVCPERLRRFSCGC
jgi:CRP-like cAMP-binding protein